MLLQYKHIKKLIIIILFKSFLNDNLAVNYLEYEKLQILFKSGTYIKVGNFLYCGFHKPENVIKAK